MKIAKTFLTILIICNQGFSIMCMEQTLNRQHAEVDDPMTAVNIKLYLELAHLCGAEISAGQLAQIGAIYGPLIQDEMSDPDEIIKYVATERAQKGRVRIKLTQWFVNSSSSILDKNQRISLAWNVALREEDQKRIDVLLNYVTNATKDLYIRGRMFRYEGPKASESNLSGIEGGHSEPLYRTFEVSYFDNGRDVSSTLAVPSLLIPVPKRLLAHRTYVETLFKWTQSIRAGNSLPTDELWPDGNTLLKVLFFSGFGPIENLPCIKARAKEERILLTKELIAIVNKKDLNESDVNRALSLIMQGAYIDGEIEGVNTTALKTASMRLRALDANDIYRDKYLEIKQGSLAYIFDLGRLLEDLSGINPPYRNQPISTSLVTHPIYETRLNFSRPRCLNLNLSHGRDGEIHYPDSDCP